MSHSKVSPPSLSANRLAPYESINLPELTGKVREPWVVDSDRKDPLDFMGNLIGDIKDTAMGIGPGLIHMATQSPIKSIKELATATWQTWSPLFHGEFAEFGENLYKHPLYPLLDLSAFAGVGLGVAGRVANVAAKAGYTGVGSNLGKAGSLKYSHPLNKPTKVNPSGDHIDFSRPTSANPYRRWRQEAVYNLANKYGNFAEARGTGAWTPLAGLLSNSARSKKLYDRDRSGRSAALAITVAEIAHLANKLDGKFGPGMVDLQLKSFHAEHPKFAMRIKGSTLDKDGKRIYLPLREVPDGFMILSKKRRTDSRSPNKSKGMPAWVELKHIVDPSNPQSYTRHYLFGSEDFVGPNKLHWRTTLVNEAIWEGDNILVVPKALHEKIMLEGARAHEFVNTFVKKPVLYWKMAQLGWRPAFAINNVIGNHIMYLMANAGRGHAFRAYVDALRNTIGEHRTRRALEEIEDSFAGEVAAIEGLGARGLLTNNMAYEMLTEKTAGPDGKAVINRVDRLRPEDRSAVEALTKFHTYSTGKHLTSFESNWFKDQLSDTIAGEGLRDTFMKGQSRDTMSARLGRGLFGVTHAVADRIVRRAQIHIETHKIEKVREYQKEGMSFDDAASRFFSEDATLGGPVRRQISRRVEEIAGDYHHFQPWENSIRAVIPFYSWDRHIVKHAAMIASDRPLLTAAMGSVGRVGAEEVKQTFGVDVPDFLKGMVSFSMLGFAKKHPSRKLILNTAPLNPYATLGDLANIGGALMFGQNVGDVQSIGGAINPLVATLMEGVTNRDILTGTPLTKKDAVVSPTNLGVVPYAYLNLAESTGPGEIGVQLGRSLIKRIKGPGPRRPPKQQIFDKSVWNNMLKNVVPVRNIDPSMVNKAYKRQEGRKPVKKHVFWGL